MAESFAIINDLTQASRWKQQQFNEALRHDCLDSFIVWHDLLIVGYAIFSVVPPEAHLVNVAIAPKYQGKGLGSSFLSFCLSVLKGRGVDECWLEVRNSNQQARAFYKKINFRDIQIRRGFYEEPKEDGWLMMSKL